MKKPYILVKEAYKSLKNRRYSEASVILEKVMSRGFGDMYILFLLAVSYLYSDQFGRANRFIRKMNEMDGTYTPLLQLKAYLQLKSANTKTDALKTYLDLLEQYPADPHLNRGRSLINDAEDFDAFQREARLYDFVELPRPSRRLKKVYRAMESEQSGRVTKKRLSRPGLRWLIPAVAAAVVLAAAVPAAVYIVKKGYFSGDTEERHEIIDQVNISGRDYDLIRTLNRDRVPFFYHSTESLMEDFDSAKKLIKKGDYNRALLLLNRIHNSNANFIVKERTDFLIRFVIDAEGRAYEKAPYSTFMEKPYLYRGFGMELEGRITNLANKPESSSFTLLVNYLDKKKLSGIAEVYAKAPVTDISDGDTVIIRGLFMNIIEKSGRPYIVARRVMKLDQTDGSEKRGDEE